MSKIADMDDSLVPPSGAVNTQGGAYVAQPVNTGGGAFVGRDQYNAAQGATLIVNHARSAADNAREQQQFEREELARAVAHLADTLRRQVEAPPKATLHPYKYLLPYDVADAARFFGRDDVIQRLSSQLTIGDGGVAVLYGNIGIGKTSLLRAGLVPALIADQHLPVLVTVASEPLAASIMRCFGLDLARLPSLGDASLQDFIRKVADVLPEDKHLFVILDQFEAFFLQPDAQRQAFLNELSRCVDDENQRDRWLISIRSSEFYRLNELPPQLFQASLANKTELEALTRDQARQVILAPARQCGIDVDVTLVEAILDAHGPDKIAPAPLALVCHALADGLAPGARISVQDYERKQRSPGILAGHLDLVLARNNFTPARLEMAWQLLAGVADRHGQSATTASLSRHMQLLGYRIDDVAPLLSLLAANSLLRQSDDGYGLASDGLRPRIQEWQAQRAIDQRIREETAQQVDRMRRSALRGLVAGAMGFALAYTITFALQNNNLANPAFIYVAAYRALPGGIAGLLFILAIDLLIAGGSQFRPPARAGLAGVMGGASFALAVFFHVLLRVDPPMAVDTALRAVLVGGVWGGATGLCAVWVMSSDPRSPWRSKRSWWLALAVSAVMCGVSLWAADRWLGDCGGFVKHAFSGDMLSLAHNQWLVVISGAVMPVLLFVAGWLGRQAVPFD